MSKSSDTRMPRALRNCHSIADLRKRAKRRLPYPIFDHIEGGSDDEVTLSANTEAFQQYSLMPRYCSGVESVDASTTVLGQKIDWPYFVGPAGGLRYLHHHGEIGVAKAAHKLGTAYAMSGWTTTTPEDVAAASDGPRFFQLQPCRSREVMVDMLALAKNNGYTALILTVDNPIHGNRERDAKSGFGVPPKFSLPAMLSIASRPLWGIRMLPMPGFGLYDKYMDSPERDMNWLANQLITNITWDDVAWIRKRWDGPFAIKGILAIEDMYAAVDAGVSAVILSNQGARHFDTAPSTLEMLPEVVDAIGDKVEVIFDSGIRRGTDILKAIALGAKACTGSRLYCYGLAAGGQAGVERALSLLRAEVERDMIFIGAAKLDQVNSSSIRKKKG
ncbi:MAG: alpha-hydroxy acid oxidase [Pseudomonadales bacterium]